MPTDPDRELAWNQLRDSLRRLAYPAELQIAAFPPGVAPDELVLEFDDFYRLMSSRCLRHQATERQWTALKVIDQLAEAMTERGDLSVWTPAALRSHPDWERLRGLASEALASFGWSVYPADDDRPIDELSVTAPQAGGDA